MPLNYDLLQKEDQSLGDSLLKQKLLPEESSSLKISPDSVTSKLRSSLQNQDVGRIKLEPGAPPPPDLTRPAKKPGELFISGTPQEGVSQLDALIKEDEAQLGKIQNLYNLATAATYENQDAQTKINNVDDAFTYAATHGFGNQLQEGMIKFAEKGYRKAFFELTLGDIHTGAFSGIRTGANSDYQMPENKISADGTVDLLELRTAHPEVKISEIAPGAAERLFQQAKHNIGVARRAANQEKFAEYAREVGGPSSGGTQLIGNILSSLSIVKQQELGTQLETINARLAANKAKRGITSAQVVAKEEGGSPSNQAEIAAQKLEAEINSGKGRVEELQGQLSVLQKDLIDAIRNGDTAKQAMLKTNIDSLSQRLSGEYRQLISLSHGTQHQPGLINAAIDLRIKAGELGLGEQTEVAKGVLDKFLKERLSEISEQAGEARVSAGGSLAARGLLRSSSAQAADEEISLKEIGASAQETTRTRMSFQSLGAKRAEIENDVKVESERIRNKLLMGEVQGLADLNFELNIAQYKSDWAKLLSELQINAAAENDFLGLIAGIGQGVGTIAGAAGGFFIGGPIGAVVGGAAGGAVVGGAAAAFG